MDIVKKNIISILSGIVAIAALVAVFIWPLDGYYEDLKTRVAKRAAAQQKISSLISKDRKIPSPNPRDPSGTESLKPVFPSAEVIKAGELAKNKVAEQSTKMYLTALSLNEAGHGLVVGGSLPVPVSNPIALGYREQLKVQLEKLRKETLNGGTPPTPDEIKRRADALWDEMSKGIIMVQGAPTNLDKIQARFQQEAAKLPEEIQREAAAHSKIYIDPNKVMLVPPSLPADGKVPDPSVIWWAQVEFWVNTDIANTISDVNAQSKSVIESPIKQINSLAVPANFFPTSLPGAGGIGAEPGADPDAAAAGTPPDPTATIPDGAAQSPTKRISNPLYDVIHFNISIDIEADQVPRFLKAIATNRFMTVLSVDISVVDPQLMQIAGYVYGSKPVVTLQLEIEEIFLRQWTVKFMPPDIRKQLGAAPPAKPASPQASARE